MYMWLIIFLFSMSLSVVMLYLGYVVSKKLIYNNAVSSPFECGLAPQMNGFMPTSIQFFIIGLIFLIFDIELILILPYFFFNSLLEFNTFLMLFFLLNFFLLGLVFEWQASMLDWKF